MVLTWQRIVNWTLGLKGTKECEAVFPVISYFPPVMFSIILLITADLFSNYMFHPVNQELRI